MWGCQRALAIELTLVAPRTQAAKKSSVPMKKLVQEATAERHKLVDEHKLVEAERRQTAVKAQRYDQTIELRACMCCMCVRVVCVVCVLFLVHGIRHAGCACGFALWWCACCAWRL